jgi:glycosyltransferase involved in cell wall biosynthesis
MNVTVVCEGFERATLRLQPWRRLYELAKRLVGKGWGVTVISDGNSGATEVIDGIKVLRIDSLMTAPFLHPQILIAAIQRTAPDVVVWYGSAFSATYLTRFKTLGKPLIWDIDTDIYSLAALTRMPKRTLLNPINSMYTHLAATASAPFLIESAANSQLVTKIVVPNNHLKTVLCTKGAPPQKVAIIPSTIELKEREPANSQDLRRSLGLAGDEFIVTYFGSPHMLRGPDVAITSMKKVAQQNPRVRLLVFSRRVVGGTSSGEQYFKTQEDYLKQLAKRTHVEAHVKIISGFLDKALMQRYLQASDAVVLPFRLVPSEPPLSIFEVMSLGKPVVTSDLGGLREIVGGNRGVLVKAGSAEDLANAILFLANNPQRCAVLARNAQAFVQTLPSWDEVAEQFERVLTEAATTT